uniref:Uncharacterized protein n=1 Tax=viral metagenome TaxID=1070528 RepID=A0A6M3JK45_9ZZZZ
MPKNGNGTSAKRAFTIALVTLATGLMGAFLTHAVWTLYVDDPRCYASKMEVRELRVQREKEVRAIKEELKEDITDLKTGQRIIERKIDRLLVKGFKDDP